MPTFLNLPPEILEFSVVSNLYYQIILINVLMCIDIKPISTKSPQFVSIYPDPVIQHDANMQADMFLACSSPKETEESEEDSRNLTVTTLSFNEDM